MIPPPVAHARIRSHPAMTAPPPATGGFGRDRGRSGARRGLPARLLFRAVIAYIRVLLTVFHNTALSFFFTHEQTCFDALFVLLYFLCFEAHMSQTHFGKKASTWMIDG